MAITNTWNIVKMDCYPEYDQETDVVFNVHWTLTGTDGTYSASVYGSQSLTIDANATFIPYDELTKDDVIDWVKSEMGAAQVAGHEAVVAQQIQDQMNPPVVNPPLPWE